MSLLAVQKEPCEYLFFVEDVGKESSYKCKANILTRNGIQMSEVVARQSCL